jgi:hypothetical protein
MKGIVWIYQIDIPLESYFHSFNYHNKFEEYHRSFYLIITILIVYYLR